MSSGAVIDTAVVLADARAARVEENAAAARVLAAAVTWAGLHEVSEELDAARWPGTPVPINAAGTAMIAAHAVAEFAAAIGVSTGSGRALIADALELARRMPKLWARVQTGSVVAWKARRVASQTTHLSPEAIAYVDTAVTPFVRGMSNAQVQRVLETAINQHMPAHAQARREQAADSRHVTINTEQISFAGTAGLFAELDLADALDLDQALTTGAAQLADLGNTETLNIRRSLALGEMSRTQYTLPLHTPSTEPAAPVQRRARVLNLFLHLHPDGTALLENTNTLLTLEQVKTWCTDPDTTITLRPVIDLAQQITTPTYAPSAQLREQVIQRDLRLPPLHHPRPRLRPRPHHPLRPPRPV